MSGENEPLHIGALLFEGIDQIDLTGPFEVFSRLPDTTVRLYGRSLAQVRDVAGLKLTPDGALDEAPQLDVLHVPGGWGQEALMEDEETLDWVRRQATGAEIVFSVCTGALICGAAGLLKDRRATTYWTALHLLPCFGATAIKDRVVVDGKIVSTAGVTAGIDGALHVAAILRGPEVAQVIQLAMHYAPEPPYGAGDPDTAPPETVASVRRATAEITARREETARRIAKRLGVLSDI